MAVLIGLCTHLAPGAHMPWYFHQASAGVYICVTRMLALVACDDRDDVLEVSWCGSAVEPLGPCDTSFTTASHRDILWYCSAG
jgi:hypothetical protein